MEVIVFALIDSFAFSKCSGLLGRHMGWLVGRRGLEVIHFACLCGTVNINQKLSFTFALTFDMRVKKNYLIEKKPKSN